MNNQIAQSVGSTQDRPRENIVRPESIYGKTEQVSFDIEFFPRVDLSQCSLHEAIIFVDVFLDLLRKTAASLHGAMDGGDDDLSST